MAPLWTNGRLSEKVKYLPLYALFPFDFLRNSLIFNFLHKIKKLYHYSANMSNSNSKPPTFSPKQIEVLTYIVTHPGAPVWLQACIRQTCL